MPTLWDQSPKVFRGRDGLLQRKVWVCLIYVIWLNSLKSFSLLSLRDQRLSVRADILRQLRWTAKATLPFWCLSLFPTSDIVLHKTVRKSEMQPRVCITLPAPSSRCEEGWWWKRKKKRITSVGFPGPQGCLKECQQNGRCKPGEKDL